MAGDSCSRHQHDDDKDNNSDGDNNSGDDKSDDDKDNMSFNDSSVMTEYGLYEGTENNLKKAFMLTHNNERIFERSFEGDNSDIVDNRIQYP